MDKLEPWESPADPEGFHTTMMKSKHFGCICEWKWKGNGDRGGRDIRYEVANCPYHVVMY